MKQTLKILFITDIHLHFQNVEKLKKWHQKHQISFDICLVGGDTANCDQNNKSHDEEWQQKQTDRILQEIQYIFLCKIYFIPGNHDPLNYNNSKHNVSQNIINCHEKTLTLAKDLQITALGGSVPGYNDKQRNKLKWKGYPFQSNQELKKYCQQKKIFEQKSQIQRIYLTHCGPFDFETSIDRRNSNEIIYGGALYYNNLIKHQNLLLYLHGHVHHASRFVRVNEIPLINPGGLINGQFGYIFLQRHEKNKKWQYQSSHFVQLQSKNND